MKLSQYLGLETAIVGRWACNLLINFLPDIWIINQCVRPALARLCGMKCGWRVFLEKGIFYGNPKNVRIGNKSRIRRGAFLDGYDKITIGDKVAIAFQVTFITSTHELGTEESRSGKGFGSQIVIGDGVWICARAIIGPGTEIGAGSVISAGAAVMQSVPPNSLVAGIPGKVVARLPTRAAANESPEPAPAPPDAAAPEASGPETGKNGGMTRAEFHSALESLLELKPGSIQGAELLADLPGWDSLAVLAFSALADSKLHEVRSPAAVARCRTVPDLVNLFPGKIT
jgi:acetyltransferase-like isoleucine patch superfamily enzyme